MSEVDLKTSEKLFNAINAYESGASKLTTWSLSIVGGSLLLVCNSSYFRPIDIKHRYFYFLFLIGWLFIGISMYHAFSITRRAMVKDLYINDVSRLTAILQKCNIGFKWQLRFFQWGLLIFGVWLILYLVCWVMTNLPVAKS